MFLAFSPIQELEFSGFKKFGFFQLKSMIESSHKKAKDHSFQDSSIFPQNEKIFNQTNREDFSEIRRLPEKKLHEGVVYFNPSRSSPE